MQNTNPKPKSNFKTVTAVILSALMIISLAVTAIAVVSAEPAEISASQKSRTDYSVTANEKEVSHLITPVGNNACINVTIEEEGYYALSATKDKSSGEAPVIAILSEDGNSLHCSDIRESNSILFMHFDKGQYQAQVLNPSCDSELNTNFCVMSYDDYITRLKTGCTTELKVGTSVKIQPNQTQIFKLKNTKDSYYNYLFANGDDLSVLVVDADFENKGYDSTQIQDLGEVCQYVEMDSEGTDFYYAVFSNKSQQEASLHYVAEKNIFYYATESIEENSTVTLECSDKIKTQDSNHFYHSSTHRFTPKTTSEYDFIMTSEGECSSYLRITNAENGEVLADLSSDFSDGEHSFEGISLKAGKVYSISSSASVTTEKAQSNVELTLKESH